MVKVPAPLLNFSLVTLLAAGGCVTTQRQTVKPVAPRKDRMEEAFRASKLYLDCVKERTDARALGAASPSDIADAALAECGREYNVMRLAVGEGFASVVSRSGEYEARLNGYERAAETRDEARRAMVARVLQARESNEDEASSAKMQLLGEYTDCTIKVSVVKAHQPGSVTEIADAALADCEGKFALYAKAERASTDADSADTGRRLDSLKQTLRGSLISGIIEIRNKRQ